MIFQSKQKGQRQVVGKGKGEKKSKRKKSKKGRREERIILLIFFGAQPPIHS